MTLEKLMVENTFSGEISYLIGLDHKNSKTVFFLLLLFLCVQL